MDAQVYLLWFVRTGLDWLRVQNSKLLSRYSRRSARKIDSQAAYDSSFQIPSDLGLIGIHGIGLQGVSIYEEHLRIVHRMGNPSWKRWRKIRTQGSSKFLGMVKNQYLGSPPHMGYRDQLGYSSIYASQSRLDFGVTHF